MDSNDGIGRRRRGLLLSDLNTRFFSEFWNDLKTQNLVLKSCTFSDYLKSIYHKLFEMLFLVNLKSKHMISSLILKYTYKLWEMQCYNKPFLVDLILIEAQNNDVSQILFDQKVFLPIFSDFYLRQILLTSSKTFISIKVYFRLLNLTIFQSSELNYLSLISLDSQGLMFTAFSDHYFVVPIYVFIT